MSSQIITQEYLKELFSYDGEQLIWIRRRQGIKVGSIAGCLDAEGYRIIRVDGKNYKSHRLIWLWVYGEWPQEQIDHVNGKRDDNKITNLRDVSQSINLRNSKKQKNNTSGITGVYWSKKYGNWSAIVFQGGEKRFLGAYDCKYRAASIRHFAMEIEGNYTERHGK